MLGLKARIQDFDIPHDSSQAQCKRHMHTSFPPSPPSGQPAHPSPKVMQQVTPDLKATPTWQEKINLQKKSPGLIHSKATSSQLGVLNFHISQDGFCMFKQFNTTLLDPVSYLLCMRLGFGHDPCSTLLPNLHSASPLSLTPGLWFWSSTSAGLAALWKLPP